MKIENFIVIFVAAALLCGCGKKEENTLREQFTELDSALTEQFYAARDEGNQAAMDSIESLYTEQVFQLVIDNKDDEWIDSLLLMTFREFDAKQKDSILAVLPAEVLQGSIMQALISKYQVEKATSEGNPYINIHGAQPDGTDLQLSELIGQTDYVLLDFWATWCGPCCRLLPRLKALYESLPEGRLEVLGVNCDEDLQAWKDKVEEDHLTWRHITVGAGKGNEAYSAYGVQGIPTTILIDRQGNIVHRSYGDEDAIANIVKQ